jgi:hypothetical protein
VADDTVRIRGKAFSAASVVLRVAGLRLSGWSAIDWDQKRERKMVFPQDETQEPDAITKGKTTPGVLKITMRRETAQLVKEHLASKAGSTSYGDAEGWGTTLQYVEGTKKPVVLEFRNQWWASGAGSEKDGIDESNENVELGFLKLLENGLTLGPAATPR